MAKDSTKFSVEKWRIGPHAGVFIFPFQVIIHAGPRQLLKRWLKAPWRTNPLFAPGFAARLESYNKISAAREKNGARRKSHLAVCQAAN